MTTTKNICILGSTGSIGQNSLEVISHFPGQFVPKYLSTNKNIDLLSRQIERFRPKAVAVLNEEAASILKKRTNGSLTLFAGEQGLLDLVNNEETNLIINGLVGFAGLRPTIEAVKSGKNVALANKESLVAGGELITALAAKNGVNIIPIDSEHSAILQCLTGERREHISRLILTASGGPFLNRDKGEFSRVTVKDALQHPNWKMGSKITIDSATMMNKGLEIIEAHWLFGLPPEKIEILVHPQSVIHSMVEFIDGSVKAQLGVPDMKIPIQYALTYPERARSLHQRLNFAELGTMTFIKPDMDKFECLGMAYDALRKGGTAPVTLNAANEVAVDLFLKGEVLFDAIPIMVRYAMESAAVKASPTLDEIIAADLHARSLVANHFSARRHPMEIVGG